MIEEDWKIMTFESKNTKAYLGVFNVDGVLNICMIGQDDETVMGYDTQLEPSDDNMLRCKNLYTDNHRFEQFVDSVFDAYVVGINSGRGEYAETATSPHPSQTCV